MSEFNVVVVQIGKVGKHPNADTLSITQVNGSYPVIFRTGDFNPGDNAVYVPVDAIVPLADPRFSFLEKPRIKAKKLRGIFSMGLLVAAQPEWAVGQLVHEELGVTKYVEPVLSATHGDNEPGPAIAWHDYDLEAYRKFSHVLNPGEEVRVTEKLHGANGRWTYQDGRLWVGSHHCWKAPPHDGGPLNIWWEIAQKYELENKLKKHEGLTLYGEVYGWVQDLRYGAESGELWLAVFDMRDRHGRWLESYQVGVLCRSMGLPMVPVIYDGPFEPSVLGLAEGPSTLFPGHIREGIVIQPIPERWCEIGRAKARGRGVSPAQGRNQSHYEGQELRYERESSMKLKIDVKREYIDGNCTSRNCPVATAMKAAGIIDPVVGLFSWGAGEVDGHLPAVAGYWVSNNDVWFSSYGTKGELPRPFSFELDVPESVVKHAGF